MLLDEAREECNVVVARVECRDVMQVATAGLAEDIAVLHRRLLQRLEAIGCESRTDDVEAIEASAAEFGNRHIRVWFQPLGATQSRLEGEQPVVVSEIQCFGEQASRLETLAMIGIAGVQGAPRHTVE